MKPQSENRPDLKTGDAQPPLQARELLATRLTPAGRGAVATVLVVGPGARDAVGSQFRARGGRPLDDYGSGRLVFGRFGDDTQTPGEEVVVRCHSDERVEVHCHGGRAAVALIEDALAAVGCQSVAWQEWLAGECTESIAAVGALAEASSRRTAAILLDQYQGALSRAFHDIEQSLERGEAPAAIEKIELLLARADLGQHLVRPWRIAVAGPPNVGKSTLVNAMLGFARSITHPAPGTTRDLVAATTAIDGWPVELVDTAGLRAGEDPIERAGIEHARRRLRDADLILWVLDRSRPFEPGASPQSLGSVCPEASILIVHNKCDLPPADSARQPPGIAVSALQKTGIDTLLDAVSQRLVPEVPEPGAAVPFKARHIEHIERLRRRAVAIDGE